MQSYDTRAVLAQVAMGIMAALCAVSSGMSLGFSGVVGELQDTLTDSQYSWFTSISTIATPVGCLTAGPLLDAAGRKPTLLLLNAPFLLGWVLLATAPDGAVAQMYAGRAFTGFATGMASIPATIYLGEMAQPKLRGFFVTWTSISISLGILLVYVLGSAFQQHWRWAAWACACVPALAVPLVAFFLPESPVWLAQHGRATAAEASLRRLRAVAAAAPPPPQLVTELAALPPPATGVFPRRTVAADARASVAQLSRPQAWKPLLIMNGFFFFQQITGIYVLVGYVVVVVKQAGVEVDPYLSAVVVGGVQVVSGVAVAALLTRCRRRPLSIWAGIAQTLSLVVVAIYLHVEVQSASWLAMVGLLAFVVAGTFGLHTLPWAMLGEVFPARVRGVAAGITTSLAYCYNFAMLKAYLPMSHAFETLSPRATSEYTFYFFSATSALSVAFVALWLPETHGRSALEIEAAFAGRPLAPPDPEKIQGTSEEGPQEPSKADAESEHNDKASEASRSADERSQVPS